MKFKASVFLLAVWWALLLGCGDGGSSSGGPNQPAPPLPNTAGITIVIDHNSVDLYSRIPDVYLNEAKKMWLNFSGESHSPGYRNGVLLLSSVDSRFPAIVSTSSPTPYRTDALRVSGLIRNQYNSWDGSTGEGEWYTNSAAHTRIKNHLLYANTNNLEVAVLGFVWCWDMTWHNSPGGTLDPVYQVHWAGASEGGPQGDLRWGLDAGDQTLTGNSINMDTYLAATKEYDDYARAHGYRTRVVFTTGAVDGYTGESGYQRELKHQRIRDYVNQNRLVLFDYADILSHNAAGQQALDAWTRPDGTQVQSPIIHPENMLDYTHCSIPPCTMVEDGDHIGEVGALRLGKALWVLAARLAGWNGN